MNDRRIVFVLGGARSGKSRFALERARALGSNRVFVATAEPIDDEMASRIARHRAERSADWTTVEAPRDLSRALRAVRADVALVDCLTVWLGNFHQAGEVPHLDSLFDDLVDAVRSSSAHVVIVANEVGLGIVPMHPVGRAFRDAAGILNQRIAALADEVHSMVAGIPLRVK